MSSKKKSERGYSEEMVRAALDDVEMKNITIRGSARLHGIPESTLRRRLRDPRGENVNMGGPTIFTKSEETQLAQHCIEMAERGYGYTRWQIIEIARNMSTAKEKNLTPTKHWFYSFLGRFPQVKMVQPKKREKVRSDVTNLSISTYFTELKQILDTYNLLNQPAKIWNVDETGISLDHTPPKVLSMRGCQPFSVTSGRSSTTTLIAAASALGQTIPSYVIYKGQRLTHELVSEGMEGSKFTTSPNGWVTSDIFLDFFANHFLQHVTERPLILLYDGHSTHITFDIIETARQSDVHLFVLPPHSSHLLQPLDVSVFSQFKKHLNTEMHKYMHSNPTCVITRQLLPSMISRAYERSMSVSNIMAGFRKTGICPFDPEIVKPTPTTTCQLPTPPISCSTRKERKDSRSIKILFEDKNTAFEDSTEVKTTKKKRKTFVPPFGAAITEKKFREMIQEKETEKDTMKPSVKRTCSKRTTLTKKKTKFQTPYNSEKSQTEMSTNNIRKGKGKITGKGKGKALAKKSVEILTCNTNLTEDEDQIETIDDEKCCICGKFQPDGLRLDLIIAFVKWAQCDLCNGWVHLKYCSPVLETSVSESFCCEPCRNQ